MLIRRALLSIEIILDEVKGSFRPILLFHFHLPVPECRLENQDKSRSDGENFFDEFPDVLRGLKVPPRVPPVVHPLKKG